MNIFLTGGSGFIGHHFINQAQAAGHRIIAIKRPESRLRGPVHKSPQWIEGDLSGDYQRVLEDCNVLTHLAAHSANAPYDTLENCMYWNVTQTLRLFEQAYNAGIRKFLVAGSCFEYGRSGEQYEFIPTDAPLQPTMSYPTSKAAASIMLHGWGIERSVSLKYLRVFQVYGAGESQNRFWPSLREAALSGKDFEMTEGAQIRDFTPVEMVAQKFVDELDFSNVVDGKPHFAHVGTGNPQSLASFARSCWKKWNAQGNLIFGAKPYRENEVMRFVPQI